MSFNTMNSLTNQIQSTRCTAHCWLRAKQSKSESSNPQFLYNIDSQSAFTDQLVPKLSVPRSNSPPRHEPANHTMHLRGLRVLGRMRPCAPMRYTYNNRARTNPLTLFSLKETNGASKTVQSPTIQQIPAGHSSSGTLLNIIHEFKLPSAFNRHVVV